MRIRPAWRVIAVAALVALGCSKDNSTPTLEGTWLVNVGNIGAAPVSPSSFQVKVWASADSYIVRMPVLTWAAGPTTYNAAPYFVKFASDTMGGFGASAYQGVLPCRSIQITGDIHGSKDTLVNAVVQVADSFDGTYCHVTHSGTATAYKIGSAGALPAALHVTPSGSWHVSIGGMQGGAISPDTFTAVFGAGTGTISANFPTLNFSTAAYDTFATAVYDDTAQGVAVNEVLFGRALHNAADAQTCRAVAFFGYLNTRPDTITGTALVEDSTMTGCALVSIGSFLATKGP